MIAPSPRRERPGVVPMIVFRCEKCGKGYQVPDDKAGRKVRCSSCQSPMRIPPPAPIAPSVAEDVPSLAIDTGPATIRPPVAPRARPARRWSVPTVAFECGRCGRSLGVDVAHAGTTATCKGCGEPVPIPPLAPSCRAPSGLGVASFALGAVVITQPDHDPRMYTLAGWGLALGVIGLLRSGTRRRSRPGWPLAGILASLLAFGFASGTRQRAIREANLAASEAAQEARGQEQARERAMAEAYQAGAMAEAEAGRARAMEIERKAEEAEASGELPTPADVGKMGFIDLGDPEQTLSLADRLGPSGPEGSRNGLSVADGDDVAIMAVVGRSVRVRYRDDEDEPREGWTTIDRVRVKRP